MQLFGTNTRNLRADWSQQVLADRAGVTQKTVSYIETGRHNCTLSVMARIADAFEVDVAKLLQERDA